MDSNKIKKISNVYLKLLELKTIINNALSPLMILSFAIGFCMFCIFIFSMFILTGVFWIEYRFFAIANFLLNIHLIFVMIGVIWISESTAKEISEIVINLFRASMHSGNKQTVKSVGSLV